MNPVEIAQRGPAPPLQPAEEVKEPSRDNFEPRLSAGGSRDDLSERSSSHGYIFETTQGKLLQARPLKGGKGEEGPPERPREDDENSMTEEQQNLLQLINEEEAALLVNGMQEYPEFVDDVISIFLRHEQIFLLSLFVQLLIELFFDFLGIIYHRETIREMRAIYLSIDDNKAKLVFWTVFAGDIFFSSFFYIIGFFAVFKRSVRYYNWFTNFCLVGLFGQMLLAYINKFNLLVFFLRILSYIYARFLSSLIMSLLLLPR